MLHVCCAKLKMICIYARVTEKQDANGILNMVGLVANVLSLDKQREFKTHFHFLSHLS